MAKEEGDFTDEGGGGDAAPKRKLPPAQTMIVLVNTLLVVGALGTMVYTKLLYERPPIVEETELKNKEEEIKRPSSPEEHVMVSFDQMTINIAMTSGKARFAKLAFTLECREPSVAADVNAKKAQFLDAMITSLGKRQITELNTIQGKLLLKTELMRKFNALLPEGGVLEIYFSDFNLY